VDINDNVALILIDSEWYLEDWNQHPTINEDCDIKTREQFFSNSKTRSIKIRRRPPSLPCTIRCCLMARTADNSRSKANLSVREKNPVANNWLFNQFCTQTGISPQDLQNKKYIALVKRIKTLIADKTNVVVVSGHDHNLQYIDADNIKQIISGAGSKAQAARAINRNDFSFGRHGYAMLQVLKTRASKVSFLGLITKGMRRCCSNSSRCSIGQYPICASSLTSLLHLKTRRYILPK
jgi:hypothetical protein